MSLVEFDGVSYRWPGASAPALEQIDFRVEEGEYIAIVGGNGSGKSTLLRLMNGLLRPAAGSVKVAGLASSEPDNLFKVRSTCALVFQSPRDQLAESVVEEDTAFGPRNLGFSVDESLARARAALEAVGLLAERKRPVHSLSAGQQQRLAIAGALAMDPRCVAFDEATSMLDPPSRETILDLMDELVRRGVAVVHVTHDMDEACRAGRIVALNRGHLVFQGTPRSFFAGEDGEAVTARLGLERPALLEFGRRFGLEPEICESAEAFARRFAKRGGRPASAAEAAGAGGSIEGREVGARAAPRGVSGPAAFGLEAASYSYLRGTESAVSALADVDLEIPEGSSLALVGKTGSGKSSLLQLLDALARPTSGKAKAFGIDTGAASADLGSLRMRAPLAIQRPETAIFEVYAADDVAFGPRNRGLKGKDLVDRVRRWMDGVGLPFDSWRDRQTRAMSGGEKRRLALAGVLAMESEALLLDEPTSSLDPPTRDQVRALIADAVARGLTVVFATHQMEEAATADRVAVMAGGRILALGSPAEIFYERFDESWGIGRPRAVRLALALRAAGLAVPGRPLDFDSLAMALDGGAA